MKTLHKEVIMEVGNIPVFELYNTTIPKKIDEIQKIQKVELLNEEVDNRNIDHPELVKELMATRKVQAKQEPKKEPVEFVISNVNFGYNPESKDFYVKVNRSDYMAQYPTDEMMKLKAYLMHLAQDSIA
jgi:uncharacterized FlaG/YvyC family protein